MKFSIWKSRSHTRDDSESITLPPETYAPGTGDRSAVAYGYNYDYDYGYPPPSSYPLNQGHNQSRSQSQSHDRNPSPTTGSSPYTYAYTNTHMTGNTSTKLNNPYGDLNSPYTTAGTETTSPYTYTSYQSRLDRLRNRDRERGHEREQGQEQERKQDRERGREREQPEQEEHDRGRRDKSDHGHGLWLGRGLAIGRGHEQERERDRGSKVDRKHESWTSTTTTTATATPTAVATPPPTAALHTGTKPKQPSWPPTFDFEYGYDYNYLSQDKDRDRDKARSSSVLGYNIDLNLDSAKYKSGYASSRDSVSNASERGFGGKKGKDKNKSRGSKTTRLVLRPVIVVGTLLVAAWATYSFAAYLKIISNQKDWPVRQFLNYYIAFAIMYFIVFVLQLFGVFTSAMPRVTLLRVYFWLSIVSWVVLLGATVLRVTLYFAKKDDIIWECMRLKEGDDLTYFNSWNPWAKSDKPMAPEEAIRWCGTWYSRALWLHVTVPLLILFLCGLFIILNHIYYHRVREEHIFSPTRLNKLKRETSLSAYGYGHGYGYGGGSGSGGEYHSSHYIPKSRTLSAQASASSDW